MQCQRCGQLLPEPLPRFCPQCGQATAEQPQPLQSRMPDAANQAARMAGDAAKAAQAAASQMAASFVRTMNDPNVVNQIPGRSVSLAGLALMAAAIALTLTPWFSGIGLYWSVLMLAGGFAVAVQELRAAGMEQTWMRSLPKQLNHPLIPPVFAAFVAVHAFQLFNIDIIALIWLGAAVLLCYDQYRKAILAPDSFGRYFDFRLAWYGYRRYILLGAALCLLSLFFTWSEQPTRFMGGWEYSYSSYKGGYESSYNPIKYTFWGWDLSGRSQGLAVFAESALLSLVAWSAFRGDGTVPRWFNYVAMGLAGFVTLWWLLHFELHFGPVLFLIGAAAIDFAVFQINRGEHAGQYDADAMLQRMRGGRP